jgi:DNA end-binding protein Ku
LKIDAGTGDPVEADKIIKGYQVNKGQYVTLEPEELDAVALETTHVVDIQQFVPEDEIDELYYGEPYYVVPDGDYGEEAFAVLREAISAKGMVAIGRVVFRSREHMVAIKPRDQGTMLTTLLYPYEVRKPRHSSARFLIRRSTKKWSTWHIRSSSRRPDTSSPTLLRTATKWRYATSSTRR